MNVFRQRGELTLSLSLLGVLISLIGIGVGTGMSQSVQQSSSQAQTGSYPYRSVLEIRDVNNKVIKWMPGLIWATTYDEKIAGRNNGDIKDKDGNAILEWNTQNVDTLLRGTEAQVSIGLPAGYRVLNSFCMSTPTSICTNMKVEPDNLTFSRISIEKNGYIQYGIRVTNDPAPTPTTSPSGIVTPSPTDVVTPSPIVSTEPTLTPTVTSAPTSSSCPIQPLQCAPRNVRISDSTEKSVEVKWDEPKGCSGYSANTQSYWIDIVNPDVDGGKGYVACAGESADETDTCTLGKEVLPNRLLKTDSPEWKSRKWQSGITYEVNVFTYNPSPSCVSPVAKTTFTYKEKDDGSDLFCKEVGQSCETTYSERCTAADGNSGLKICNKKGTCSAKGDESKCSWDTSRGSSCGSCVSTGPDDSCKYLGGNPYATDRIVFLPVGFESVEEFEQAIIPRVTEFEKTNLREYKDRFNYSFYTRIGKDGAYGCREKGNDIFSCRADHEDAQKHVSVCNGNISVVVIPKSWNVHTGYAYMSLRSLVLKIHDRPILLTHELGHALFGLADEYLYAYEPNVGDLDNYAKRPNCSYKVNDVCKWGDGSACIAGCSFKSLYRPSEESVMNPVGLNPESFIFNDPSMKAIHSYFAQRFAPQVATFVEPEYKNSLVIHMTQEEENKLVIDNLSMSPTYSDNVSRNHSALTDKYYEIEILGAGGDVFWTTQFPMYVYNPHNENGYRLNSSIVSYLPYFKDAHVINVKSSDGKVLLNVELATYSVAPPLKAGNLCGNAVCDAGNGETTLSCRADCGEQLIQTEFQRADFDQNDVVNGLDFAVLIDRDVYGKTDKGDVNKDGISDARDLSLIIKWYGVAY